ncbi:hypothetical protein Asp14428_10410 [Actinoplanes sp. NBRC 14428]|uniref:Uncharacterized protein n=1 Tax=Pseudosporangium ferrugineum TaxID=439699 RepID=A0A2T0SFJ7_9ACTN|nr:hypothetical protein [Pseudosporangium ferrugineum]PRY32189.1 hypothetical protein CLV70_102400 [Pseudosporangium ferrugineum]BCJ49566.1 hypothetical protein Asp14428_10410 [Actinoplanes sp. NBRC 14428]
MTPSRLRRSALVLAASVLGSVLAPGVALADGPGYGGTADSLTVQWRLPAGTTAEGLAVYAVGFKSGSPVKLRVGAAAERPVVADAAGALRVIVVSAAAAATPAATPDTTVLPVTDPGAAGRLSPGTSVLAVGQTPAGALRTLVGSVPPPEAGRGLPDVAPWAGAAAVLAAAAIWTRRRGGAALSRATLRYRHPARHRA